VARSSDRKLPSPTLRQAQGRLSRKRREKWGNHFNVSVNFNVKAKININGKGNGQECPFHTGWAAEASVYFLVDLVAALKRGATQRAKQQVRLGSAQGQHQHQLQRQRQRTRVSAPHKPWRAARLDRTSE
jgi:hypothetical protein